MKSTYPKSLLPLILTMCFLVGSNTLFAQEPIFVEIENAAKPDTEEDISPVVDVLVLPDTERNYSEIENHGTNLNTNSIQDGNGKPSSIGNYEGANTQGEFNQEGADIVDTNFDNEEKAELQVSLYPNPANNYVNLRLNSDVDYTVVIVDLAGNRVNQLQSSGTSLLRIDLMNMTTGIYFLQITCCNSQQTVMMKVVK